MPRLLSKPPDRERLDPHVWRVVLVVVLSSIMSILDSTIVNVALRTLSHDLHTTLNDVQWVVSAYLLALAAVIPLSGWAVRRWGAFRVYMWSLVLFTVGSGLCAIAGSYPELVVFRVLQGLGGGMLVPTGMTLLVQAAGRENLSRVMAAIGVPTVIAPILGPVLGGVLVQTVGWHAIFTINLPIGVLTAIAAVRLLPRERPDEHPGKLDWIGLLLAAAGTVGITYGLSESATVGTFTSRSVILPIVVGLVMLGAFVARSRRIRFPLLDFSLYRIRAYSSATVVMFGQGAALFAGLILLPLFFQVSQGQDVIHTGLMLIPQGIGGGLGSNRSAQATRWLGAGLTSLLGALLITGTTVPFLFFGATTSYALIAVIMVFRGIGIGMAMMPAMTAAFSVLHHDQVNDASPQLNVIQRVGGSLGTAVVAVILQDQLRRLGDHPTAAATAIAFNRAYLFVVAMSVLALIPAVFLWRIERKSRAGEGDLELAEEALAEVIL